MELEVMIKKLDIYELYLDFCLKLYCTNAHPVKWNVAFSMNAIRQ